MVPRRNLWELRHPQHSTREDFPFSANFLQVIAGSTGTESTAIKRTVDNGFIHLFAKSNPRKANRSGGNWKQLCKFRMVWTWENPLVGTYMVAKEIARDIRMEGARKLAPDAALRNVILHNIAPGCDDRPVRLIRKCCRR